MNEPELLAPLPSVAPERAERLPLGGLLALAIAGFITVMTEALPAGLLLPMSEGLNVSHGLIGQLVTLYAVGSLLAAIPLVIATRGWRRRPLLLIAIAGFSIVNSVTALSESYGLTLVARFFAGVFAGLLWALLAGYASRMVAPHLQGRAIAVAMLGAPLALSLGVPAGTYVGNMLGWRTSFALISVITVALIAWVRWQVPDFPGQSADKRLPLRQVIALPGLKAVLFVTLAYVLAHTILYTYIAPFLEPAGLTGQTDQVLLVFGLAALLSIWIAGLLIDCWLRPLMLLSCLLFIVAALLMATATESAPLIYAAVAIWGLGFGALGTLLQTALAKASGDSADTAQSMLVTMWNLGMAGGGLAGGVVLERLGAVTFPWVVSALLLLCLLVVFNARQHGFPARS